jgi:hypothetical protein
MSKNKRPKNHQKTWVIIIAILAIFFLLFSTVWVMVIYLGNNPSRTQPPTIPPTRILPNWTWTQETDTSAVIDQPIIFEWLPMMNTQQPEPSPNEQPEPSPNEQPEPSPNEQWETPLPQPQEQSIE